MAPCFLAPRFFTEVSPIKLDYSAPSSLASLSVLEARSTTKDYIRAEGDFIKRCIVGRTNKAEISPEEQSKKAESGQENLWTEI